ncbi:hypothetical protein EYR38_009720 [Pleurotus pulmonarius]|nr:hypothetical protein EYR38_009720 [Pleurotus pulmonarius]
MTGGAADDEGAEEVTCTGEVVQEGDASGDEDGTAISNAPEEKDEADDSSEEDEEDEDSFEEDEEDEDEPDEESPLLLSCKVVDDEVVDEADDSSADEDAEDDSLDEELDSDEEVAEDDAEEDSFAELTVDEVVVDFPSPPWEVFDEEELADEEDAAAEADSEEDAFEDEDSDVVVVTLPLHPPPVVDDVLEDEAALSLDAAEDEELLEDEDSSDEAVVDDPFPFPLEPWSVVEVVELEEVEAELLDCELAADEDEEELVEDDEGSATSEPPQVQAGVVYSERQGLTPPVSQDLQTTMTSMEVKMPSAVSRFVDTTELLEGMLKSLPPGDLRKTITVSRQWSDVSLDVLWREVHSVATLCRGLAPVVGDHHATRFTRELEQSDWDRFDSIYASRIRTLHQKASSSCVQLVDQLSRTRPRYAILPNLRSLHWNGPLVQCLTFMHPDVKKLVFTVPENFPSQHLSFSQYFHARLPDLQSLELKNLTSNSNPNAEQALGTTIEKLTKLRQLTLPCGLADGLMNILSNMPKLEALSMTSRSNSDANLPLSDGAFSSLAAISLVTSFAAAAQLFNHPKHPPALVRIRIKSPRAESPAHMTQLLDAIAASYPRLGQLHISCLTSSPPPDINETVDIRTIRPILRCTMLRALELAHYYPFRLLYVDVEEIAISLPHIETLVLNSANCPKLERLGLYLGLREEDIPASDQNPQVKFNNLRTLCTGFSSVSNPRSVAFFLSFLCPWLADFVRGDSWMGEEHNAKKDGSKEWDEIESLLPFLASVRAHERASVHRNLQRTLGGGTDKRGPATVPPPHPTPAHTVLH